MNARQMVALEESGWIIELDQERGKHQNGGQLGLPSWMIEENRAWALVPLIHFERLAGAVLLARTLVGRELDWEDLYMLRVVGRQVASYISEAQGREAHSGAKRLEEFIRVIDINQHSIKTLISQLTMFSHTPRRNLDTTDSKA